MAQAKFDAVQWFKKNYFWVACGLMACVASAVWWLATARLSAETKSRAAAIESKEKAIKQVASRPHHPNRHTQQHMEQVIAALAEDVYDAWRQQYQRQRALLTWPAILGQDFISVVQELQPIEAKVRFGQNERELLLPTQLQKYRDFIDLELPKLADIVGAEWLAGQSGGTPRFTAQKKAGPVVLWDAADQAKLQKSRFYWGGRNPTTLEVLYAQEDYWVLRSVLEIIKATNGDVQYRYQASIKTIQFIDIGRDVMGMGGTLSTYGSGAGASMMPGGESDAAGGLPFPASGLGGMGGLMAGAGSGAASIAPGEIASGRTMGMQQASGPLVDPGDNRYVDLKFAPLTAQRIRQAFDSKNPDDAFLMVAKRMPVRLRVKIDQRKIPKFLAECGNARMQLEVKQVRINQQPLRGRGAAGGIGVGGVPGSFSSAPPPGEPTGLGAGAGGGTGAAMSLPPGGGYGGAEQFSGERDTDAAATVPGGSFFGGTAAPMGPSSPMQMRQAMPSDESPFDVDVEVYGIVYIYNPVDRQKLGMKLEDVEQQTPPAEPPAAAGPAAQAG